MCLARAHKVELLAGTTKYHWSSTAGVHHEESQWEQTLNNKTIA